jgi:hypothetical protein
MVTQAQSSCSFALLLAVYFAHGGDGAHA